METCLVGADKKEQALAFLDGLVGDCSRLERRNRTALLIGMVGLRHCLWRHPLFCRCQATSKIGGKHISSSSKSRLQSLNIGI